MRLPDRFRGGCRDLLRRPAGQPHRPWKNFHLPNQKGIGDITGFREVRHLLQGPGVGQRHKKGECPVKALCSCHSERWRPSAPSGQAPRQGSP